MRHVFAVVRVIGLALFLLALVIGVTLRQAQAHFRETLSGFGRQLASLGDIAPHSSSRKLFVNGLEIRIETISTPLEIADALDRFADLCHSVKNIDLPAQVREKLESSSTGTSLDSGGIVRQQGEADGYVGCLDIGRDMTAEGLVSHLLEFGRTQNLRSLGQLRYAVARRSANTTTLVVLWTEGDAKLNQLFPKDADAPGSDLFDVPRPEQAKRLLSAFEERLPYGFAAYRVEGQPMPAVFASYRSVFEARGWTVSRREAGMLLAEKNGRKLLVQLKEKRPGSVIVTLSDLG